MLYRWARTKNLVNQVILQFYVFGMKNYYENIQEKMYGKKIKLFLPYVFFILLLLILPFIFLLWPMIIVNIAIDFGFLNDVRLEYK